MIIHMSIYNDFPDTYLYHIYPKTYFVYKGNKYLYKKISYDFLKIPIFKGNQLILFFIHNKNQLILFFVHK